METTTQEKIECLEKNIIELSSILAAQTGVIRVLEATEKINLQYHLQFQNLQKKTKEFLRRVDINMEKYSDFSDTVRKEILILLSL